MSVLQFVLADVHWPMALPNNNKLNLSLSMIVNGLGTVCGIATFIGSGLAFAEINTAQCLRTTYTPSSEDYPDSNQEEPAPDCTLEKTKAPILTENQKKLRTFTKKIGLYTTGFDMFTGGLITAYNLCRAGYVVGASSCSFGSSLFKHLQRNGA